MTMSDDKENAPMTVERRYTLLRDWIWSIRCEMADTVYVFDALADYLDGRISDEEFDQARKWGAPTEFTPIHAKKLKELDDRVTVLELEQ